MKNECSSMSQFTNDLKASAPAFAILKVISNFQW